MNNGPKYFRLTVYGKAWGSIEQLSHLVFENRNGVISRTNVLMDLIFTYFADKDLSKAEEFLKSRGFISFGIDTLPPDLQDRIVYVCCDKYWNTAARRWGRDEAIAFINENIPNLTDLVRESLDK